MAEFTPTVSIIIPVYNGAQTIGECLNSLVRLNYPYEAYEVIVVENGSTDNTTQIVQQYPVRLLHSQQRGPAAARNMGIGQSKAEVIVFTDADCIAHPDWLLELVKPYQKSEIGGVAGEIQAYRHPDRNFIEQFSDDFSPLKNFISGEHEFLPHLYTANASYRRELLLQVGGFNPGLFTGEDVDLSWRIQLQTSSKIDYAPQAVIEHRHRATRKGLARQYRQYGFGEILLDTLYGRYPGYPRQRGFQVGRLIKQILALCRYTTSMVIRRLRLLAGRATLYQAAQPGLLFLIESNNIRGKLEALWTTRGMTRAPKLAEGIENWIERYY